MIFFPCRIPLKHICQRGLGTRWRYLSKKGFTFESLKHAGVFNDRLKEVKRCDDIFSK